MALLAEAARAPSLADAGRLLLASPAWRPAWLGPPGELRGLPGASQQKYDVHPGAARSLYVLLNFAFLILCAFSLVMWGAQLPWPWRLGAVALILLSLASLGGLLELRRWAVPVEAARWLVLMGAVAFVVLQRGLA